MSSRAVEPVLMRRARWIRFGIADVLELRAAGRVLASELPRDADPIVLWSAAPADCGRAPDGAYARFGFVAVVPPRITPGKPARWATWMLSPMVAAYRDFGARAYLEGAHVVLRSRRIASASAEAVCGCAVISAELGAGFGERSAPAAQGGQAAEFRGWLREGLGLAATQWRAPGESVTERALETALRDRIEAQHGWQFENCWPRAHERSALDRALRVFEVAL